MIKNSKNNKKKISYIKMVRRLLFPAMNAYPIWTYGGNLMKLLSCVFFAATTIYMQKLFDTVASSKAGSVSIKSLIFVIIATAIVIIFSEISEALAFFFLHRGVEVMNGYFDAVRHDKLGKLPAAKFEEPDIFDKVRKATVGAGSVTALYYTIANVMFFALPYLTIMGIYLFRLRPLLLFSLIIATIPGFLGLYMRFKIYTKLVDETTPVSRRLEYYESEMYKREYFKETRILGSFLYIKKLFLETLDSFCEKSWKAEKKSQLYNMISQLVSIIAFIGVMYLLVDSLIKGFITPGAFAAVFASLGSIFGRLRYIISGQRDSIGSAIETSGVMRYFLEFLEQPEDTGNDIDIDIESGIDIKNVSYVYPCSENKVLSDINLSIKHGETLALVGENGAGKTTLVRLITGILKPTEGKVLIGGVPTDTVSPKTLFLKTSGVFQNYRRYPLTLVENVTISDAEKPVNEEKMQTVLAQADVPADESVFPQGAETMLSREFDGVDLSGGQWQRVALARGLYRDSQLIVLDEPTSAIDPIEETKLYKKFKDISSGKTALIVTHRLGSAKIADRIIVMSEGNIIETGTHEELIKASGHYANMYNMQAKWYSKS